MNRLQKNRSSFLFQYNKLTTSLSLSNILHIKTSLYLLLKKLKDFKGKSLVFAHDKSSLDSLEDFCYKLEVSGFYTSFTEKEKKDQFKILKSKILEVRANSSIKSFDIVDTINNDNLTKPKLPLIKNLYQCFGKRYQKRIKDLTDQKRVSPILLRDLVSLKNKYLTLLESRLFLHMVKSKKKYTKLLHFLTSKKLRLRKLYFIFKINRLNYTNKKQKRYKLYKNLTWKRKKKKRRKKVGLFYFLRRRPRMLFRFYVPRHLEINYKTFSLAHLGSFDLSSTNSRIGFWLNLRRLLTFLAL